MISSGLQRIFYVIWTIIKLSLFFWLFSLVGLLIFGVGPAFQTVNYLLHTYGMDYQSMTFHRFKNHFQKEFKRNNLTFLFSTALFISLSYNLYLSVQIQGWLWLLIDFILIISLILIVLFYLYSVMFQTFYDIDFIDCLKLSAISLFVDGFSIIKVLFGLISIGLVTFWFKGLILFATVSLISIWMGYSTQDLRTWMDKKMNLVS